MKNKYKEVTYRLVENLKLNEFFITMKNVSFYNECFYELQSFWNVTGILCSNTVQNGSHSPPVTTEHFAMLKRWPSAFFEKLVQIRMCSKYKMYTGF